MAPMVDQSMPRGAPPAIPVRARFYLTKCPGCGWVGSSEQCDVDHGCDDSDVYCPVCGEAGCEDDPCEADARAHGEAVLSRIRAAEQEAATLRARLQEAERALKPFAEAAVNLEGNEREDQHLWESPEAMMLSIGDLLSAKLALLTQEEGR